MAKNKFRVIAGDNKGHEVIATNFLGNYLSIWVRNNIFSSYAVDLKHTTTECYEIITEETLEFDTSKILADCQELKEEIKPYIEPAKERDLLIVAVKFKNGNISVMELNEKMLMILVNALQPHPLTRFI